MNTNLEQKIIALENQINEIQERISKFEKKENEEFELRTKIISELSQVLLQIRN